MFVVFGSPRSGTTLLASTLNLNDHIVIPHETDFIIPTAFIIDRVKNESIGKKLIEKLIVSSENFKHSIGEYLSERDIKKIIHSSAYSITNILSHLYQEIAYRKGATIAGDKSPNDLNFLRILVKTGLVESDIKVVHIIRDIRDVILSLKRVDWGLPDIETWFPRLWNYANLYLYNLYKDKMEKYLLIKYEDMVTSPFETFQKITHFLNVPFQEKMFDHHKRGNRYHNHPDHKNISSPFLTNKVGVWKNEMDPWLKEICEKQANEALKDFGYFKNNY
ncbi:MAG: sulfotransferase [Thermoplasmata archaeon]